MDTKNSHVAARKRRKLQQAQLKVGEPPSGTGGGGGGGGADQVPQTKNTVAVLNELKRNLVYNLESQSGPVHAPLFTMSVVVSI
ncbi:adenosine deaminase acting on RNA [Culex quinquefasciatus]|uniref:Adenosine deaminase acting on RNA n=1 Tax=Culex quinquefasciatus TaxID=7176 RepID=B0WXV2_CULQU|nr:adenosine deaminase acting on RNA [Culex quinquefasciatus]|eukprot:XP_001862224.1 adenosine deaminase acting on RNA [Culex quinquefasciatus]